MRLPWPSIIFAGLAELACIVLLVQAMPRVADASGLTAGRAGLLALLAVGYGEATRRSRLLQRFLHLHTAPATWSDRTSVWTCAAALTLPSGWAYLVVLVIYGHAYLHAYRHRALVAYKAAFNLAMPLLSVAVVLALRSLWPALSLPTRGLAGAAAIVVALLCYTLTGLLLAVVFVRLADRDPSATRWRDRLPGFGHLTLEAAGLVLALIVAQLLSVDVALAPVVLVLLAVLARATTTDALANQARHDPKTGLLTLPAWRESAQGQLARRAGSVLLVDLDHFKQINDRHGHLAGDAVLLAVTAALRGELRHDEDLLGRFGGEEFVVWAPVSPRSATGATGDCRAIAERLCRAVRETSVRLADGTEVEVTASVGICAAHAGTGLDEALAAADRALYDAKATGRNRAVRRALA